MKTSWYRPPGDATGWLWRKQTEDLAAFAVGGFGDLPRHKDFSYDGQGHLLTASTPLQGTVKLVRVDSQGRQPAPTPGDASAGGGASVSLATYTYDPYGNRQKSLGPQSVSCEVLTYDTPFALVPITDSVFTQSPASCSGTATLTSSAAYDDLGFGKPTLQTAAPDMSWSTAGVRQKASGERRP